ncbi:MAG: DNA alkylation repair protein [Chloroflexi bacterium]|nr:DNA alkylation repair protein [Chloroflexota bacterium]
MADKLKDLFFTHSSINEMGNAIQRFYPSFDKENFTALVFGSSWEAKELKEKMRHTTVCLHEVLPESYEEALDILMKVAPSVKGFDALALPEYVMLYGMDNWDLSLPALRHFTQYSTSELAIRPFLKKDLERIMEHMSEWAEDGDPNIRRLASEGCRPRLPWALGVPQLKKDPSPILPILEKLKNDESDDVRRSVANNLNDISKDHPELVLGICEEWYGQTKYTDKIVKHACRSLLKAGNERALAIFGITNSNDLKIEYFKLNNRRISIGENLMFSFELIIDEKKDAKVRLEYCLSFRKANGSLSKKVFKIAEGTYRPGKHPFTRKYSFVDLSTRKHYAGDHHISIILNGIEAVKDSFELMPM